VTSNRRDGMVIRILRQLLREARLIAGKIRAIIG